PQQSEDGPARHLKTQPIHCPHGLASRAKQAAKPAVHLHQVLYFQSMGIHRALTARAQLRRDCLLFELREKGASPARTAGAGKRAISSGSQMRQWRMVFIRKGVLL